MKRKKIKELKWMKPCLKSLGSINIEMTSGICTSGSVVADPLDLTTCTNGNGAVGQSTPTTGCLNGLFASNGCNTGTSNINF